MKEVDVIVANEGHIKYVDTILKTIADAAKVRGTGIAKRSPEYVATKMREAKAVIALDGDKFAGFSYIETWGNKHYVTTSGLIVHPDYRGLGLAKRIKALTFTLARVRWPHAKIFSLTSGSAVMKMNTQLGYLPVTFNDLTDDESFWRGCEGASTTTSWSEPGDNTASVPPCSSIQRNTCRHAFQRMSWNVSDASTEENKP